MEEQRTVSCVNFNVLNLYNNLAKPFTTVGADPLYAQTSRPRPPQIYAGRTQIGCGRYIGKKMFQ
jgi:hypothetical protein